MISVQTSLIIILIGTFVLMSGILLSKEPNQNFQNTFTESAAWGLGFALLLTLQVAVIAAMF
jgi:hypothetical protein